MKSSEFQLFRKVVKPVRNIVEFGSGGSTFFLLNNNKSVYSVESNPQFFQYMNSLSLIRHHLNKNLFYNYVDIGPTSTWGRPTEEDKKESWSDYYLKVWNLIKPQDKIDVIFIDGRFRVLCTLKAIETIKTNKWDSKIVIHDFWNRPEYHSVLQYLDETERSKTLGVFTVKDQVDLYALGEAMKENKYNYN